MTDKFDMINGALVRIGANEIASLGDETTEANTARRLYPNTIKDLGSRYPWRFLMFQEQLARLSEPTVDRWTAVYQIPTQVDVIKSVTVGDSPIRFDRYNDRIYCDAGVNDVVILDYVCKFEERYFPGYFCTLVEFELAANFAIPVGDRADLAEHYEKKALRHFSLAKNIDAQGRTAQRMPTSRFRRARLGYGNGP